MRLTFFYSNLLQTQDGGAPRYAGCLMTATPVLYNRSRIAAVDVGTSVMLQSEKLLIDRYRIQKRSKMDFGGTLSVSNGASVLQSDIFPVGNISK